AKLGDEPGVNTSDIAGTDDRCAHGSPHSCLIGLAEGEVANERLVAAGFFGGIANRRAVYDRLPETFELADIGLFVAGIDFRRPEDMTIRFLDEQPSRL